MPSAAGLEQLKERLCRKEHVSPEECKKALLPSLEHASSVHSHLHHSLVIDDDRGGVGVAAGASGGGGGVVIDGGGVALPSAQQATVEQTRNAAIYISLVVVVYVVVIMWLVSSSFRAAAANAAASGGQGLSRYLGALADSMIGAHRKRCWRKKSHKCVTSSPCGTAAAVAEVVDVATSTLPSRFSARYRQEQEFFDYDDEDDDEEEEDDDDEDEEEEEEDIYYFEDEELWDGATDTEALLVLQDEKGRKKPRCTTHFEEDYEGEPV